MEQKVTSTIIMGVVISLILIVIDIVAHLTNIIFDTWFKWIPTLLLCIAIIIAVIMYGKQMNNNVTFGNLFAHGFKVSATVACFLFVFAIISVYLLFPDFVNQVVDKAMDEARKQGKMSEDQIQQGLPLVRKITSIGLLVGSVIGTLIVGAIAALIGAAVAKKNPQSALENQFK